MQHLKKCGLGPGMFSLFGTRPGDRVTGLILSPAVVWPSTHRHESFRKNCRSATSSNTEPCSWYDPRSLSDTHVPCGQILATCANCGGGGVRGEVAHLLHRIAEGCALGRDTLKKDVGSLKWRSGHKRNHLRHHRVCYRQPAASQLRQCRGRSPRRGLRKHLGLQVCRAQQPAWVPG